MWQVVTRAKGGGLGRKGVDADQGWGITKMGNFPTGDRVRVVPLLGNSRLGCGVRVVHSRANSQLGVGLGYLIISQLGVGLG